MLASLKKKKERKKKEKSCAVFFFLPHSWKEVVTLRILKCGPRNNKISKYSTNKKIVIFPVCVCVYFRALLHS